jgi:hypothetical protein
MRVLLILMLSLATDGLGQAVGFELAPGPSTASRPLTQPEGEALVKVAWQHRRKIKGRPDCSNLVHQIYEEAGLPYTFANSNDLMDGHPPFKRVTQPQPGDLVVWTGHVGIVVDPEQRTFYSSLRSGLRTDFYDAAHWRRRGKPRFLRYLTATTPGLLLASADRATAELEIQRAAAIRPDLASSTRVVDLSELTLDAPQPGKQEIIDAMVARGDLLADREEDLPERFDDLVILKKLEAEKVKFNSSAGRVEVKAEPLLTIGSKKLKRGGKALRRKLEFERAPDNESWRSVAAAPQWLTVEQGIRALTARMAVLGEDLERRALLREYQQALQMLLEAERP